MVKCRWLLGVLLSLVPTQAAYFESATLGPTGVAFPGPVIFSNFFGVQYYGVRFDVGAPVLVTAVGAHIAGNPNALSPVFAAIVPLLPGSIPDDFTLINSVATTTFQPPALSTDLRVPLLALLNTGTYGLVIGAGLFGSPNGSEATLIDNGVSSIDAFFAYTSFNVPGIADVASWQSLSGSNVRLVVEASPIATGQSLAEIDIPEPAGYILTGVGLMLLSALPLHRLARLKRPNLADPFRKRG